MRNVNWVAGVAPFRPIRAQVKIRYKAPAMPATVTADANGTAVVQFDTVVQGVAPGQGAVFYAGERCLGGRLIADHNRNHVAPIALSTENSAKSSA